LPNPGKTAWGGLHLKQKERDTMTYPINILLCEPLDDFGWDTQEIRDLIRTNRFRSDEENYDAEQPFAVDGICFARRWR
jgi:hypothetical protein